MIQKNSRNFNKIAILCYLTIISTVLTQVPTIASMFRPVMYVMWITLLIAALIGAGFKLPTNRFLFGYCISLVILVIECAFCNALFGTHSDSYMLQVLPIPLLCYIVGLILSKLLDQETMKHCLVLFFFTALIMFSYIFITYVGSFSVWLNANDYIYEQKNSAAQIIGCTIIATGFLIKPNKKWVIVGKYMALSFMFLIIIAIQCRTALVGLIITATVYYFLVLRGKKKIFVTVVLLIALVAAFHVDIVMQYVVKAFVFTERQTLSLDNFTSGRITYFENAIQVFKEHPIFGTGHFRVDNLYLCSLSDVGLIGAVPFMVLWLSRIVKSFRGFSKNKNAFNSCVICLTVFYFSESMFEAYPPFGPGVCAFMFWIICAFFDMKGDNSWERIKA